MHTTLTQVSCVLVVDYTVGIEIPLKVDQTCSELVLGTGFSFMRL